MTQPSTPQPQPASPPVRRQPPHPEVKPQAPHSEIELPPEEPPPKVMPDDERL